MTGQPSRAHALNVEEAVRHRYSQAATQKEASLCCPVDYEAKYLDVIPQEILDRDYGCGDPSRYINAGETVLDLGSGGGKICYIIAQIVGSAGKVFGVDCNDEMLALARKYQTQVGEQLGFKNVEFRKGKIQDLQLDLEALDRHLNERPVENSSDFLRLQEHAQHLRETAPLIPDGTVDVIVSNCVLNLVRPEDRTNLFREMYRVLSPAGRVVISDIVSDEDVPAELRSDARLWSGCLSGAFREDRLIEEFERVGFYGMETLNRQDEPWAIVDGIEFRSTTVRAFKGKEGPCLERKQAVIYNGPWKSVVDDDGHTLRRGERMAVCDKTFQILTRPPYTDSITPVEPHIEIPLDEAGEFTCNGPTVRLPSETKGGKAGLTVLPQQNCCGADDCC